jgi:hypothetical protein
MAIQRKYARNIYERHAAIRFRNGKRIELAPRGQRGDVAPLTKDDFEDDAFIANHGVLFEVITAKEAEGIIEKQATNIQQSRHPAFESIRNELGDEYDDTAIRMDKPEAERSIVVAQTEPVAEGVGDIVIDRGVGIRRAKVPGSEDRPVPDIPDSIGPEEQAQYRAQQAQEELDRKELEDALGDAKVVVEPPQKGKRTKKN